MLGNGSPKDMAMNLIKQNNNPIFNNLIEMANKGDTKGLEQFARNIFKEQGKNFDTEFNNFMNNFK
jgi:hypothetical protein